MPKRINPADYQTMAEYGAAVARTIRSAERMWQALEEAPTPEHEAAINKALGLRGMRLMALQLEREAIEEGDAESLLRWQVYLRSLDIAMYDDKALWRKSSFDFDVIDAWRAEDEREWRERQIEGAAQHLKQLLETFRVPEHLRDRITIADFPSEIYLPKHREAIRAMIAQKERDYAAENGGFRRPARAQASAPAPAKAEAPVPAPAPAPAMSAAEERKAKLMSGKAWRRV